MSGLQGAPPMPGEERSKLILAGGFSAVAAILAAWLVIWLVFFQARLKVIALASGPAPAAAPESLLFQDLEVAEIGGTPRGAPGESADLIAAIGRHLDERRGRAAIVYLSAPALRSYAKGPAEVVLASRDVFDRAVSTPEIRGVPLEELLDVFRRHRGKRLLILDIGRTVADSDVGAFGDDVVAELARLVPPPPGDGASSADRDAWRRSWKDFAILCSCAPGQWVWSSDADVRSVFGYYVSEGLRRGGDVQDLLRRVPAQVAGWVGGNRGAAQTPIVLGDRSLTFTLPRESTPPRPEDDPRVTDSAAELKKNLERHYETQAALDRGDAFLLDPLAWRDYRRALLRAERSFRAGRVEQASERLEEAARRAAPFLTADAEGLPSLALASRFATDPKRREALDRDRTALDAMVTALASPPAAPTTTPEAAKPGSPTDLRDERNPLLRYAEGQPIRWVQRFARALGEPARGLDAQAWLGGSRPALIGEVLRVRALAETAAASAIQPHPWIIGLVVSGDSARRSAQDRLFAGGDAATNIRAGLDEAATKYRAAIEVARAIALAGRVESDLPYLGAWYVRRQSSPGQADVRELLEPIARATRDLDDWLDGGLRGGPLPAPDEIPRRVEPVRAAYRPLVDAFETEAKAAQGSGKWRRIDAVLAVPSVEPGLRKSLVEESLALAERVALRPRPVAPEAAKPSVAIDLAKKALNNELTGQALARDGLRSAESTSATPPVDDPGPLTEFGPDAGFEKQRRGMALLEWCLQMIGRGEESEEAKPLHEPSKVARGGAVDQEGPREFARPAREGRRLLAGSAAPASRSGDDAALVAFERARLAVPPPDVDREISPGRLRWTRLLLWHADRLREDADDGLATRVLGLVPQADRETEAYRGLRAGVDAIGKSILLRHQSPAAIDLADDAAISIPLDIEAPDYPRGRASLLVGAQPPGEVAARITGDPDGLAAIGEPRTGSAGILTVDRLDRSNRQRVEARLSPIVFYRGHVGGEPGSIKLALMPTVNDFDLRLKSTNVERHRGEMKSLGRNPEVIKDQLEVHPGECVLYARSSTFLSARLTYHPASPAANRTRQVQVVTKLDGVPIGSAHPLKLEVDQPQSFDLPGIDASAVRNRDDGRLLIEVNDPGGKTLFSEAIKLRVVEPAAQYLATARADWPAIPGPVRIAIRIERRQDDPIGMDVGVWADVEGGRRQYLAIQHSNREMNNNLQKRLGREMMAQRPNLNGLKVVLHHGEWVDFIVEAEPSPQYRCLASASDDSPVKVEPPVLTPPAAPAGPLPVPAAGDAPNGGPAPAAIPPR